MGFYRNYMELLGCKSEQEVVTFDSFDQVEKVWEAVVEITSTTRDTLDLNDFSRDKGPKLDNYSIEIFKARRDLKNSYILMFSGNFTHQ